MDSEFTGQIAECEDFEIPALEDRDWKTFRVRECRGITVVELRDVALVGTIDVRQFAEELDALIGAEHNRIVLNFGAVTHLSCQVLDVLLKAHRRCVADGGLLRLCEIQLSVAEVFALTGLGRRIEIYPDERPAIEGTWPRATRRPPMSPAAASVLAVGNGSGHRCRGASDPPRPAAGVGRKPPHADHKGNGLGSRSPAPPPARAAAEPPTAPDVSTLAPLPHSDRQCCRAREDLFETTPAFASDGHPAPSVIPAPIPLDDAPARTVAAPEGPPRAEASVRLIVLLGRAQGQAVEMTETRLVIGRDACCRIRAQSPVVSRVHAIIERRCGRVFVRDIGSANGTFVNDRKLLDEEVEVGDGDRLGIGPMQFAFAIGTATAHPPMVPTPQPVPAPGHATQDTSYLLPPPIFAAANPPYEVTVRSSSPSIADPGCGAAGGIRIEEILLQLLRASGHAAILPGPAGHQAPPSSVSPANGSPHAGPAIEAGGAYPLAPSSAGAPHPVSNGVPSSPPRATYRPPTRNPPTADAVDDSLERAVLDALETLDHPHPETTDARAEEPDAGPRDAEPRVPNAPAYAARAAVDFLPCCCPECGTEGRARMDQLGRQLSCKQCGARFYLDAGGDLVIGDRARVDSGRGSPWPAASYGRREPNFVERLADRGSRNPGPFAIALGAAALLVAIGWVLWTKTGPAMPPTLEGRATYAAEAFAHESRDRLRALATSGTARDVEAWLNLVRPRFWQGKIRDVRITVSVAQQDGRKATVRAHLAVPGGPDATDPPPAETSDSVVATKPPPHPAEGGAGTKIAADGRQIDLMMFWERSASGGWRLDGARTFKTAVRTRSWAQAGIDEDPSKLGRLLGTKSTAPGRFRAAGLTAPVPSTEYSDPNLAP